MVRLASVSVDLDGLENYHDIHGLPARARGTEIYERAVPRFCALFGELGIRATFFAIGRDLEIPENAAALRRARDAGHEVGNHTYNHRYDFVRLGEAELEAEVRQGEEAIRAAVGEGCVGFRAPGYNIDERVLAACRRQGYRYDSSVFPSYPYYLAKAAVMAALRTMGRPSRATLGGPKVLFSPTRPYIPHPGDYRRQVGDGDGEGLVELPIAVIPGLRFPFIGTWICLWSDRLLDIAYRFVRRSSFVNLELHGIELLGLEEDGLDPALRRQPDLRVPLAEKRRKLARVIERLRSDYELLPLAEAAARIMG
jgi:hypothetical protein